MHNLVEFSENLGETGDQIKDFDKHMTLSEKEVLIQDSAKHMRCMEWSYQKFISDLNLPIYGKMEHFNYYDCFAAFVKYVFVESHTKDYDDRQERIENAVIAGNVDKLPQID